MDRGKLDNTLAAMFSKIEYSKDYLFYAHMIGQCSIKIDTTMPSPAGVSFNVDHYNLYINPVYFNEYTLQERLAILKHEMLHILYNHIQRTEDRELMIWNYSTDCALNQHIDKNHLPKVAITPKTLGEFLEIKVPTNQSAEFYYNLIKNNQKTITEPEETMDDHKTWELTTGDADLQDDLTKKMIEKSQEETIKSQGNVPSECNTWLELFTRKSEVNWKKVLRGIVGNKRCSRRTTIMRSDRRFPKRTDLRGKTKDRTFNLLVVADVSGSMNDSDILDTLGEVKHICSVTKTSLDLIQIDTEAYEPEKLDKSTKIFTRKGRGGTDLYPAVEKAQQNKIDFNAVVVLTDGGVWHEDIQKFQDLGKKVIWLVSSSGHIPQEMNSGKMKAFFLKDQ